MRFHLRSQLYEEPETSTLFDSHISQLILMKCGMLPQPVGLLKLMLNLFHMINIKGENSTKLIL